MIGAWLFAAAFFPALQVLPLYAWAHLPRSATVTRRMAASSLAALLLAWRPTRRQLAAAGGGGTQVGSSAESLRAFGTCHLVPVDPRNLYQTCCHSSC